MEEKKIKVTDPIVERLNDLASNIDQLTQLMSVQQKALEDVLKPKAEAKPLTDEVSQSKVDESVEGGPTVSEEDTKPPINKQWRAYVDQVLGPDFKIEVNYPAGGGQKFVIFVPKEKSNAGEDHWEMYGHDKRSKPIGSEGFEGMKAYVNLVAKNLGIKVVK